MVGSNLGDADFGVMFVRWWNPAVESQAVARAIRFGRKKVLHIFRFLINDTIEQRIAELLSRKNMLFEEYIEGAETAELSGFTRNDLLQVLGIEA